MLYYVYLYCDTVQNRHILKHYYCQHYRAMFNHSQSGISCTFHLVTSKAYIRTQQC